MKRIIVVAVALAFVLLSVGAALAAPVSGSKHDMRTHLSALNGGYDEVCVYCHTPHGAAPNAPLWNHSLSGTGAGAYTPYSNATSSTMNADTSAGPGVGSLLCLSCHDGTVAVDSMVNPPNNSTAPNDGASAALNGSKMLVGTSSFGIDLSNDHPIGFAYTDALVAADGGLGLRAFAIVNGATNSVRLINGNVECASCHNAHDSANAPFLRSSNANSDMCLVCHIK
jgi:predicted CXXCH cytochrome family protein